MADLEERLALHAYLLEAVTALGEAEKRIVTALGYAQTISGGDQSSELIARLTDEAQQVRAAARTINEWLDGTPM